MYKFSVENEKYIYELTELAKEFDAEISFEEDGKLLAGDKNSAKKKLFQILSKDTGIAPSWGTLTGVRPLKLYNDLVKKYGKAEAQRLLTEEYMLAPEKVRLLSETSTLQSQIPMDKNPKAWGLYIGIPFCPTRCLYCSFTSNAYTEDRSESYLAALYKEIDAVSKLMAKKGAYAESIYIGGGTPTSLNANQLSELLQQVKQKLMSSNTKEFTVEAGRPDTITAEKLQVIKQSGAGRISINPQTMKAETLKLIGRNHSPEDIEKAFVLAHNAGIEIINADLITGLPEENCSDFVGSLNKVIALGANNITVHTLAVKRASRLIDEDPSLGKRQAETVKEMLAEASRILAANGYKPYYLYRQKNMSGNYENVGYCKEGTANIYNIRIMEEDQSIIALGAGGISKSYYPEENRLERIPNVSNYEIYIDRIDEMIKRKEEGFL